ncbi:MAG: hypothetical protein JNK19_01510 [Tabrizicola sp.]|nr:hypothetical protein [Tabrizicola sp.]
MLWTVALALAAAVGLFLLRHLVAWRLRKRLPKGLVPDRHELSRPDSMSRLLSLIGHAATPAETLGLRRLRATLGLRLVLWVVFAVITVAALSVRPPLLGVETGLILLMAYLALHTSLYEISYDRDTVTLPRWWFGRTTRKWRDLDAVVERRGWYLDFHFRDGTAVQAHKYVVGYAALREKAEAVLREV